MKTRSLIAFDTDHIKGYVFATNTLKEIRGASSLLDRLNRDVMVEQARLLGGRKIYAHGGSGLFLIDSGKAEKLGIRIQEKYRQETAGGASVTYVVQPLPTDAPDTEEEIMTFPMPHTLALLRYRLRQQKATPPTYITEASHPLMRPCDSCGTLYAVHFLASEQEFYCQSCLNKQNEDSRVKDYITTWIKGSWKTQEFESPLWKELLDRLKHYNYYLPAGAERPKDLNVFRTFRQAKDYLGLIYADGNGMGKKLEELSTLQEIADFAQQIDETIYWAMCDVINQHLTVKQAEDMWIFPFDILLMGGDDLILVAPAAQAMTVAYAFARRFYTLANREDQSSTPHTAKHTLSVGVVLAPTNYPFSLLLKLAENTLKFAKQDGSKTIAKKMSSYENTRVNFLVVSGNTSQSFEKVYRQLHQEERSTSFSATMRPYTLEQLESLLSMLREANQLALGRTKLHQLREAVLQLNLSTSVTESLAVLRSWKEKQRDFVVNKVYSSMGKYPLMQWDEHNPAANFPIVTFPWTVDNQKETKQYQTFLLDFVELYDFIPQEGGVEYDNN